MEPKLVLFVAITAGAFAARSKFQYEAGSTYEYTYSTNTRTTIAGAAEHFAGVSITADVTIEALTSCEMMLTLAGVQIQRSDPRSPRRMTRGDNSGEFQQSLEARPLRFSYQDGVVEEVCPDEEEPSWVLNIKRGVLSAFQNSMGDLQRDQRITESDVTGECSTDYRVTQRGWQATTISKTKDLLACESRHGFRTSFNSLPYKMPNTLQSLPLLKSKHECQQTVTSEGILKKTTCTESHVFRPFSKENNGAITEVSSTLEYRRSSPYTRSRQGFVASRAPLTFEHSYGLRDEDVNRREASAKLQELCDISTADIRPEVPQLFSQLVTILKNSNDRGLDTIYRQLERQQICSENTMGLKFFIDAIPMIGSVPSLRMMRKLIDDKSVDEQKVDMWLTSLAFIQNPTIEMIQEIQPLMDSYDSDKSTLLIAAMVNNLCVKMPTCADIPVVDKIISKLERNINRACVVDEANYDDILMSLRAIGNIGHAERLAISLEPCFTRDENPMEIRIAALDAFRRIPCGADRNNALQLYRMSEEDAELRIAAYLVVMQCPSEQILQQVQETLASEKANQVGSFVWTHLLNIQETSSPFKQEVKQILEDDDLAKDFNLDNRKYSRNYEGSLFSEKLNAGAMVESNWVWSSKSFVPRSATLNLTVDLFGQSVNLFELGGRVEGLEGILESILGPEADTKMSDKKTGYQNTRTIKKEKMDRMKKTFGQIKDELHASVFMRIFGNELSYMHFDSDSWPLSKDKFNFLEFLQKLSKDHEYSFSNNYIILDSSVIVPTCNGLPLNLTVQGASSVLVTVKGKMDLMRAVSKPRSLLIDGHIQPSGALEITGTMTVDAFVTKTGLKVVTNVHSSTSLKGRVELSRGQSFNLELDLPQDKMEIVNLKSSFFIVHDKVEREQRMIQDNRKSRSLCWGDRLVRITGVDLCGEVAFSNASMINDAPYFPFTGPVNFGITLNKKDSHTGYKMVVKSISTKDELKGEIGFETPGGREKRTISLNLDLNKKQQMLQAGLVSPWKEVALKSSLVSEGDRPQAKALLVLDQQDEYMCDAQVLINRKDSAVTYVPLIRLKNKGESVKFITGKINRDGLKNMAADLVVTPFNSRSVNLKGEYVNTAAEKKLSATYSRSKKEEYTFLARSLVTTSRSSTRVQPTLVISVPRRDIIVLKGSGEYKTDKMLKMDVTINMDQVLKEQMKLKGDLSHIENKKRLRFKGKAQFNSEFLNFKLAAMAEKRKGGTASNQVALDYSMPKVKQNKVTFNFNVIDKSTKSAKRVKYNANFDVKQNPEYGMTFNMNLQSKSKLKEVTMKLRHGENVHDTKNKQKELFVHAKTLHKVSSSSDSANIDYNFKVLYPLKEVDVKGKGHYNHDARNLASTISVDYGIRKTLTGAFKLRNRTRKFLNMEGSFHLAYPGRNISLVNNVTQLSRSHYVHRINFIHQNKEKTSFFTTYENPAKNNYKLSSEAVIHGYKPVRFDGSTKFQSWRSLGMSAKVTREKMSYGFSSDHTIRDKSGKMEVKVFYPKEASFKISSQSRNDKYSADLETTWPSDTGDKSKMTATVSFTNQGGRNRRIGGDFEISCPFPTFTGCSGEFDFFNKDKETSVKGSAGWGRKKISASAKMDKPLRVDNFGFSIAATTPFEGYETLEVSVSNKYDQSILTQGKVIIGPHNGQVKFNADYVIMPMLRDINAGFEFKSSHRVYRIVAVTLTHHSDNNKIDTQIKYNDNGDIYSAETLFSLINTRINFNGKGQVILISPKHKLTSIITHEHQPYNFKTTINTDWGRDRRILVDLTADYKKMITTEINGGMLVQTPWKDFDVSLQSEFSKQLLTVHSYVKSDRKTVVLLHTNYRRRQGEADFDISVSGSALPNDITGKINVPDYIGNPKRGHAEVQWATAKKISIDLYLDLQTDISTVDSSLRITTPFQTAQNILLKYENKKQGRFWVSKSSFENGLDKYITVKSEFGLEARSLRVTVETSRPEMKHLETGLQVARMRLNDFKVTGDLQVRPVLGKLSGELSWTIDPSQKSMGKFRVDTPFQAFRYLQLSGSHQPKWKGKSARLDIEYHPRKLIEIESTYNVKSYKDFSIETTLKTPYPNYRKHETEIVFKKVRSSMEGRAIVKTNFHNLQDITINFDHAMIGKNIKSHGDLTYGIRKYESDVNINLQNGIDGTVTLRSPIEGFETIRATLNHQGMTWSNFNSRADIQYADKRIDGDLSFMHGSKTSGSFNLRTPFEGFEIINADMNREGDIKNLKLRGSMSYGVKTAEGALQYSFGPGKLDFASSLKSPWFEDVDVLYNWKWNHPSKESIKLEYAYKADVSYGKIFKREEEVSLKVVETDFQYYQRLKDVSGVHDRTYSYKVAKEGGLTDFTAEASFQDNNKLMSAVASYKHGKISKGSIIVKTPFENYTNVGLNFDYTGNENNFNANSKFNIRDGANYEAHGTWMHRSFKRVQTKLELMTPHVGHEKYTLNHKHSLRKDKFMLETVLYNGRRTTSSLEFSTDYPLPQHVKLNIATPFEGYRKIEASGLYEKRASLYSLSATAEVGKHGTITSDMTLDTSGHPYTGDMTINTPFRGYEDIKVSFEHSGGMRRLSSSMKVNAPKLIPIDADLTWAFKTWYSMDGRFTMNSGLPNMENVKAVVSSSAIANEYTFYNELGWQRNKVISIKKIYSLEQSQDSIELSSNLAVSTPFQKFSSLNFNLNHVHTREKVAEKFSADFNGKSYLDGDMDYTYTGRHDGSINIRAPRPMSMVVGAQLERNNVNADLYVNWNDEDPESNIKFETAYNNKSYRTVVDTDFKFKVIHPVRTMGIEAVVKKMADSMQNKAMITWDQKNGKTFAYDVQWSDRNRPYRQARDGSVKLVIPTRSVKVSGSYTNSTSVRTLETSLLWDADRDTAKQVLVKLDMDQNGRSEQRSMHLHLPYIKKDYRMKTSLLRDQGSVIVDGSAEFSYSDNPRKALVLSSKVENLGSGSHKNYSVTVGISHPSTYTNLELIAHAGHSSTSCSTGLITSYQARRGDKKYFVLRGEVNRRDKQLDFQASSPLKHVLLTGKMTSGTPYHVSLTNRYDHTKVVSTDVTLDPDRRTLDIGFAYNSENPQDRISLSAGYVNDSAIWATVFRESDLRRVTESEVALRLNTSNILHTRITWRPAASQELQQFLASKAQVYKYMMNEAADEVSQAMGQEVTAKYKKIANEILTEVRPVFTMLEQELGLAKVNLDLMRRELRRAYGRNDLFIKDMGEAVNAAFNKMFGDFGNFVDAFEAFYMKTERTLTAWLHMVKNYPITAKYMQFIDELLEKLKNARKMSEANMRLLGYQMEAMSDKLYRSYLTESRALQRKLNAIQGQIMQHPGMEGLRATYTDFKTRLSNLPEVNFETIGQLIDKSIQEALEPLQLKDAYNTAMTSSRKLMREQLNAIRNHPDFRRAASISNEIYQQLVWAYKYWEMDKNLRQLMVKVYYVSRDLVFMELNHIKDSLVDLDKSRVIVYDPLNGHLQFEVYLPIPLRSLAELPDLSIHSYIRRVKIFAQRYLPGSNQSIWDTYYKLVPAINTNSWLPPYKAYGAVIGNQHFITYDKTHYDFAGRCSYVLTRDMVDDNFTVVLNYDNNMRAPKRKSVLVMLRGASIEVDSDYRVKVNDRPTELPFTRNKIEAVREYHQIVIDDGTGLTVQIDPEHDLISVGLSGWYHGRVAGLLGTFDNEQSNDLTSADRSVQDVTEFANSWEVGRRSCRSSNKATEVNMADLDSTHMECVKYFQAENSYFKHCFSVVPVEEFLHSCVGYMQSGKSALQARCLTAGQYFHQCRTNGVYLQMPKDCVSCELTAGLDPISLGDAVQLTAGKESASLPSSADVILVLEERHGKQWTPAALGDLVTDVDSALTKSGISKNRFGLVGYGGPGRLMTEHSHTFDGHMFTKAKGFLKGVENIEFSNSAVPADGLTALRKATNYPFRAGVAKVLLYIPQSDCEANRAHVDMDALLKKSGFTMHILRNSMLNIDDNRPVKNVLVFGMDSSKIMTRRSKPGRNQEMFRHLVHPADTCAQLALATNGSVFDSTHMLEGGSRVRKDLFETFASRVADTSMPPACQTCRCELDEAGQGKTICRPCNQASFMWKYMPNWWSNNTGELKQDLKKQIQDSLLELRRKAAMLSRTA